MRTLYALIFGLGLLLLTKSVSIKSTKVKTANKFWNELRSKAKVNTLANRYKAGSIIIPEEPDIEQTLNK